MEFVAPAKLYTIPKISSGPKLGQFGLNVRHINAFDIKGTPKDYILLENAADAAIVLPTPSIIKSVDGKDLIPPSIETFVKMISGLDAIKMEIIALPEKWTLSGTEKYVYYYTIICIFVKCNTFCGTYILIVTTIAFTP